jgi:hypothetical protein
MSQVWALLSIERVHLMKKRANQSPEPTWDPATLRTVQAFFTKQALSAIAVPSILQSIS